VSRDELSGADIVMGCWRDGPKSDWAVATKGMKCRGELNAASAYLKCITRRRERKCVRKHDSFEVFLYIYIGPVLVYRKDDDP
jgi:hypothetical protein